MDDLDGDHGPTETQAVSTSSPDQTRRPRRAARVSRILATLVALAMVAGACGGDQQTTTTSAGSDDPTGGAEPTEDEDPMEMVATAAEMTVNEVTGMFETELVFGGVPGGGEVTITGQGHYDFAAPAWEVMVDYSPVFEGALPEDVDTTATASWVDGSYYLTSEVLGFFSGSDVDTVKAESVEDLVENEELADSGLGVLTSAFAANPMGALLQAPAAENLAPDGEPGVVRYTGDLRLGDAYGADAVAGVPNIITRDMVHDTHVAQTGLDPDPVLEDFVVGVTVEIDADDHLSETGVTLDIGEVALAAGLEDAAEVEGASLSVTQEYTDFGALLEAIEAPQPAVSLADYRVTISF
jgi:hypothetical protein